MPSISIKFGFNIKHTAVQTKSVPKLFLIQTCESSGRKSIYCVAHLNKDSAGIIIFFFYLYLAKYINIVKHQFRFSHVYYWQTRLKVYSLLWHK